MGSLIRLKDGTVVPILTNRDLLDLIEIQMGSEVREAVIEYVNGIELEHADDDECIRALNEIISGDHEHYREVMEKIHTEAKKLASLISEKDLDRRAISNTTGAICVIASREANRC